MEIFKEIEGYPNYMISNYGNVYSKNLGRNLKPWVGSNGRYLYVGLCKDGKTTTKMIHRLVAEYFVPNKYNKEEVNHKNYNDKHNYYQNLEWCTRKENMDHCFKKDSPIRNFNGCTLYYKDFVMGNFKSITSATRYANDMFNASYSMLHKHHKHKNFKIIAMETQSTIQKWSTPDDKLLVEVPTPLILG